MTATERAAIIGYLTGKGWTTLSEMRYSLKWPQALYLATNLGTCVNMLEREGVVCTTKRGDAGFMICLSTEVLL